MEFNDEVTEGYIIRSEPAEHEELKDGDIVRLIVSKGPEKKPVVVPSFAGMQIDAVLRSLVDSWHLTCTNTDIEYVESEAEPNSVIWQSIEPNTTATEWDTIKFQVSKGIHGSRDHHYAASGRPHDGSGRGIRGRRGESPVF